MPVTGVVFVVVLMATLSHRVRTFRKREQFADRLSQNNPNTGANVI